MIKADFFDHYFHRQCLFEVVMTYRMLSPFFFLFTLGDSQLHLILKILDFLPFPQQRAI